MLRPYTVLGTDVVVKADAELERMRRPRPRLHRPRRAPARRGDRPRERHSRRRPRRGERRHRRRVLRRRARDHQPVGEDLPVQDGRARRARHVVDRVGEQGRPHAVRPARRARSRERRHHLGGRRPARDGLRHRAQEGLGRLHQPRHEPVRACAQARADRRPQPERRARDGPRAVDGPARRASRCAPSGRRAASASGSRRAMPTASRSASWTSTAPTSTKARSARSNGCLYREDFRRAFAGDIGDIVFPPRAIEFYTAALESSVQPERLRRRAFKVVLDYSFGAVSILMPNVLAKLGASVLAVNPFAATSGAMGTSDDRETRVKTHRRSRPDVGLRPRATSSTPTARPPRSSTTRASRSRPSTRCSRW